MCIVECAHIAGPKVDPYLHVFPVKFRCVCVCLHFPVSLWARQELQMDMQGLANCCTKIFLDCRCSCEERPSEKDGFGTHTLCSCTTESKQSDDWVVLRGRFAVLHTLQGLCDPCQQPSCTSDNTLAVCAPSAGKDIPAHTRAVLRY